MHSGSGPRADTALTPWDGDHPAGAPRHGPKRPTGIFAFPALAGPLLWLLVVALLPASPGQAGESGPPWRPLDQPWLPILGDGVTVMTSLDMAFPNLAAPRTGPRLEDAERARLALPFSLALVSDLETSPPDVGSTAPLHLHGRFRPGQPVAVLSMTGDATCPGRTGDLVSTENVYGTAFSATRLASVAACPAGPGPILAVVGLETPAYRRLTPRPVADRDRTAALDRLVHATPGLFLSAYTLDAGLAPLPLRRVEELDFAGGQVLVLTYGGTEPDQPATLVMVRNGQASQFWLGCGGPARFFQVTDMTFLAYDYQQCDAGRRAVFVYRLDGPTPLPVLVNADFSG